MCAVIIICVVDFPETVFCVRGFKEAVIISGCVFVEILIIIDEISQIKLCILYRSGRVD